jgi:hypothetical protein
MLRIIVSVIMGLVCRCPCHAPLLSCRPPHHSIAIDAHNPPYEQMLVGMGCRAFSVFDSLSMEQILMALGHIVWSS